MSKLRPIASFWPELLVGELPMHMDGHSRIERGETNPVGKRLLLSGEDNYVTHLPKNFRTNFHPINFKYSDFPSAAVIMHVQYVLAQQPFVFRALVFSSRTAMSLKFSSPTFGLPYTQ